MSKIALRRFAAVLFVIAGLCQAGCGKDSPTAPDPDDDVLEVAGTWAGTAAQAGGPLGNSLALRAVVTQAGPIVTGTYRIESLPYYIDGNVGALVRDDNTSIDVTFTPTSFNVPPGIVACSMTGTLQYAEGPTRFTGTMRGTNCIDVVVDLRKQ